MAKPTGPYSLIVKFVQGHAQVIGSGHNPVEIEALESKVARNPRAIDRIELHDLTGPLRTIWSRTWGD